MNFLFILNPNKLNSVDCATRAIHILKSRGCEVYTLPIYSERFQNLAVKEFNMSDDPDLIDMVVTIRCRSRRRGGRRESVGRGR